MKSYYSNILLIVVLVIITPGCKLYKYKPDTGLNSVGVLGLCQKEWEELDEEYVFVLHNDFDIIEFYDLIFIEDQNSLVGRIRPFEGLSYYYFEKTQTEERRNYKRPFWEHRPQTNQIHLYVNKITALENTLVKFNLNQIEHVDIIEQSHGWNLGINAGVIAVALAATLLFYNFASLNSFQPI